MLHTMEILTTENVILLPPSEQALFLFVSKEYILELYITKFSQYVVIKNFSKTVALNLMDFVSCVKIQNLCSCLQLKKIDHKEICDFVEEFIQSIPTPKKIYLIRNV